MRAYFFAQDECTAGLTPPPDETRPREETCMAHFNDLYKDAFDIIEKERKQEQKDKETKQKIQEEKEAAMLAEDHGHIIGQMLKSTVPPQPAAMDTGEEEGGEVGKLKEQVEALKSALAKFKPKNEASPGDGQGKQNAKARGKQKGSKKGGLAKGKGKTKAGANVKGKRNETNKGKGYSTYWTHQTWTNRNKPGERLGWWRGGKGTGA